jgi:hypothetical protein
LLKLWKGLYIQREFSGPVLRGYGRSPRIRGAAQGDLEEVRASSPVVEDPGLAVQPSVHPEGVPHFAYGVNVLQS